MRVAVMLWGGQAPSLYRESLRRLAEEAGFAIFSDSPRAESELFYLRFSERDGRNPFDLVIHNVDDAPEFSASFPYIVGRPGVLFLGDLFLHGYARAVSHAATDGWGYRWIVNVACPEEAETLVSLAERGIGPGALARKILLAPALAVRSAAVVVPDFDSWRKIFGMKDVPPVEVIPPAEREEGIERFQEAVERKLPKWADWARAAAENIAPLEHPYRFPLEVERQRVVERFWDEDKGLAGFVTECLAELMIAHGEFLS
jgi:hypothetical protein